MSNKAGKNQGKTDTLLNLTFDLEGARVFVEQFRDSAQVLLDSPLSQTSYIINFDIININIM